METFEVPAIPGSEKDIQQKTDRAMLNYIKRSLRATLPWTRLLSILGFLFVALSILSGLALIFGRSLLPSSTDAPPLILTGIINVAASIFYLIPSIWLFKYSSAISRFLSGGGAIELANALVYQKSFWKFVGILTLVAIIIAILGILAAIFIPTLLMFRK
jgi:magnesium-transporting ATPase (P-type)